MMTVIHRFGLVAGATAFLLLAGCSTLINAVVPNSVTVRLVNNGQYPVTIRILIADNQDVPEDLLSTVGSELDFTLAAGQATSFERKCDELQAIKVDEAQLEVIGGTGPTTDTGVLRDGQAFNCNDVITFTFDHSSVLVDFNVSTSVSGG